MRKQYIPILYFSIAVLIMSCKPTNEYVSEFKVVKFEVTEIAGNSENSLFKSKCDTYFGDANIKFYANDSVALLSHFGNYSGGTWNNIDEQFNLSIDSIGKMQFIKEDQFDEKDKLEYLVMTGKDAKSNTIKLLLKKNDYFDSKESDLLSYQSNWWRIKPNKKETHEQIKKRVIAQLDYMIAYFELIGEREYRSFYESHLNSPYRLYSNGISLESSYLNSYNQIFYSYDDAAEAYKMLSEGLNSIVKYPKDPDSIAKGYINVFKEIKRFINIA